MTWFVDQLTKVSGWITNNPGWNSFSGRAFGWKRSYSRSHSSWILRLSRRMVKELLPSYSEVSSTFWFIDVMKVNNKFIRSSSFLLYLLSDSLQSSLVNSSVMSIMITSHCSMKTWMMSLRNQLVIHDISRTLKRILLYRLELLMFLHQHQPLIISIPDIECTL